MGANQQSNIRYAAIKAEVTPGTYVPPTNADFNIRIKTADWTPNIPMDDEAAKYMNGSHAEEASIAGAQSGTINLGARWIWGGAVGTEPKCWKLAYMCGLEKKAYGVAGLALLRRNAKDDTTYSITLYDREIGGGSPVTTLYKFAGCVGNFILGADGIGKPWFANVAAQGKLIDIVDGTALVLDSTVDTVTSEDFLSNTFSIGGITERISSWSFDIQNQINPVIDQSDPTGYSHFVLTGAAPRFKCNPLAKKQATRDVLNEVLTETSGIVSLASSHYTLKLPKTQIISHAQAMREGLVGWDLTLKAMQNGEPGALIDSDLTLEDTFELLHGARA